MIQKIKKGAQKHLFFGLIIYKKAFKSNFEGFFITSFQEAW